MGSLSGALAVCGVIFLGTGLVMWMQKRPAARTTAAIGTLCVVAAMALLQLAPKAEDEPSAATAPVAEAQPNGPESPQSEVTPPPAVLTKIDQYQQDNSIQQCEHDFKALAEKLPSDGTWDEAWADKNVLSAGGRARNSCQLAVVNSRGKVFSTEDCQKMLGDRYSLSVMFTPEFITVLNKMSDEERSGARAKMSLFAVALPDLTKSCLQSLQ